MRHLCVALLLTVPAAAKGQLDDTGRQQAIRRGIAYLETHVFRLPDSAGTPRKPFTMAVTGLCFLMEHATGKNRVGKVAHYLERWIDDVARQLEDPSRLPPRHGLASSSYLVQYTWPVAAAGLFFAELELRKKIRKKRIVEAILRILVAAQQANGGWGHGRINPKNTDPFPGMGGYPDTLVSSSNVVAITVGQLHAMGYECDDAVAKARQYYRAARLDNGSFPYDPSQHSSGRAKTNAGRTAGSIYAWHCLGMPRDKDFKGSVDYLMREFKWIPEGHGSPCLNMMHGALACHMLGRETWRKFRRAFEARLIAAQTDDGCLECICEQEAFGVTCDTKQAFAGFLGQGQKSYTTALHTFVLLLDRGELRVLKQRKPGASITRR